MPLGTSTVGTNQLLIQLLSDPSNASGLQSVLTLGDAKNLTGLYAALAQNVPLLLNASGNYDPQRGAIGTVGIPAVNTEGSKATYSAGIIGFTPVATPTDICSLVGSGSKTVRLTRLSISGTATAAASLDVQLLKRSAADTGGTPTTATATVHDSNDAAATAVFQTYAANPGLGALVGLVRAARLNLGAAGAAGTVVWDFTTRNSKGLVLRGTAQTLSLNWNGTAVPSGTALDLDCEWTEE